MKWRWKARIQNAVAALPLVSNPVYYAIQRNFGGLRRGRRSPLEWFGAAVEMVDWAKSAGKEVEGKRFLEVGTGRVVNVPLVLWLCGAAQTVTVDLNTYLSRTLVFEAQEFIKEHQKDVEQLLGAEAKKPQFQERLEQLVSFKGDLPGLLKLMNIVYMSPADATKLPYPDRSFDFHISYTVLEHIPGDIILQILKEARRILAPGGLVIHFIDPSDHFSHDDESITAVNFLQFSDSEWDKWAGNQFMYHNRLRNDEYLKLFQEAGVRILKQQQVVNEQSLETIKNGFQLNSRFRNFAPEELATITVNLMGDFPDA